jgi:endonuclease V-like protein UPF0215 family
MMAQGVRGVKFRRRVSGGRRTARRSISPRGSPGSAPARCCRPVILGGITIAGLGIIDVTALTRLPAQESSIDMSGS